MGLQFLVVQMKTGEPVVPIDRHAPQRFSPERQNNLLFIPSVPIVQTVISIFQAVAPGSDSGVVINYGEGAGGYKTGGGGK